MQKQGTATSTRSPCSAKRLKFPRVAIMPGKTGRFPSIAEKMLSLQPKSNRYSWNTARSTEWSLKLAHEVINHEYHTATRRPCPDQWDRGRSGRQYTENTSSHAASTCCRRTHRLFSRTSTDRIPSRRPAP